MMKGGEGAGSLFPVILSSGVLHTYTQSEIMEVRDRVIVANIFWFVRLNSGGEYVTHTEIRSAVFWLLGFGVIFISIIWAVVIKVIWLT